MFEEFKSVSAATWLEKITTDLKGKPFEETLLWGESLGLNLKPHYHTEDAVLPVQFPLNPNPFFWKGQSFSLQQKDANKSILNALIQGVNSISLSNDFTQEQLKEGLKDVILEYVSLHLIEANDLESWKEICNILNITENQQGSVSLNDCDWSGIAQLPKLFRGIVVSSNIVNPVDRLVNLLRCATQKVNRFINEGASIDEVSAKVQFNVNISQNYFIEIAALRALRYLWANVVDAYQPEHICSKITYINGIIEENDDANQNLLIGFTTQCMAAIIGTADECTITANSFDERTLRNHRNIQNILLEESYLRKVKDPSKGSYFIEQLTSELANKAWEVFTSSKD